MSLDGVPGCEPVVTCGDCCKPSTCSISGAAGWATVQHHPHVRYRCTACLRELGLKVDDESPFVSSKMTHPARARFQYSAPTAQRAEAHINLREAQVLLAPRVPAHLREPAPKAGTTAAGACFRRVNEILNRKTEG